MCCIGMCDDVVVDGFFGVGVEYGWWIVIDLCYYLVCNNDSNFEFISKMLKSMYEFGEMGLMRVEFIMI